MRPLGWLCLLASLLGGAGQEQLRLGIPLRAMVAAQHYQLVAFPTRDVPPTCDLVFSLTVYAGRAKLFARDPTGYPMKVRPGTPGLTTVPAAENNHAVYLLEVVGYTEASYALLAYCAGDSAHPVVPEDGVPLQLLCLAQTYIRISSSVNFTVSVASLTPRLAPSPGAESPAPLATAVAALSRGAAWRETAWAAAGRQLQALRVAPELRLAQPTDWGITVNCTSPTAFVLYAVRDGGTVLLAPGYPFNGYLPANATQRLTAANVQPAADPSLARAAHTDALEPTGGQAWALLFSGAVFEGNWTVDTSDQCARPGLCPDPGDPRVFRHTPDGELAINVAAPQLFTAVRTAGGCAFSLALSPFHRLISLRLGVPHIDRLPEFNVRDLTTAHVFRLQLPTTRGLAVCLRANATVRLAYSPVLVDLTSFPLWAPCNDGECTLTFPSPARPGVYYLLAVARAAGDVPYRLLAEPLRPAPAKAPPEQPAGSRRFHVFGSEANAPMQTDSGLETPADVEPGLLKGCPLAPRDPKYGRYAISCANTAHAGRCELTCDAGYHKTGDAMCMAGTWVEAMCAPGSGPGPVVVHSWTHRLLNALLVGLGLYFLVGTGVNWLAGKRGLDCIPSTQTLPAVVWGGLSLALGLLLAALARLPLPSGRRPGPPHTDEDDDEDEAVVVGTVYGAIPK